jgi:two-component system, OmpR family, response regulator
MRSTENQEHLLIVDDDREIRTLLTEYLEKWDYRITAVRDGEDMHKILNHSRVDLIILDVMLPGKDGLALCRELRTQISTPILMLTARGDETDRIIGLEMGADDYLPKPFNPRELLARIRSILRRAQSLPPNLTTETVHYFYFAGWTLDVISRELVAADGLMIPLSGAEYRLLRVFIDHAQKVLSRDQLLELVQGRETVSFDRSIDVLVGRLRRRLNDDGKDPKLIKTVRGFGYVLTAAVSST